MKRAARIASLMQMLDERIMLLDGAMGTMIQSYGLDEDAYRGERFRDWASDLKGNNDLLSITKPAVIQEIHRRFLEAGADIIETNTFNANAPSMGDYGMADIVPELNLAAARLTGYAPMLTPGKVRELAHPDWTCDNAAIFKASGWRPRLSLGEGMKKTLIYLGLI